VQSAVANAGFEVARGDLARPQDLADAHQLYEIHGAAFDLERVRRRCRDFGAEERVEAVL
jgi:hypothetical protein